MTRLILLLLTLIYVSGALAAPIEFKLGAIIHLTGDIAAPSEPVN